MDSDILIIRPSQFEVFQPTADAAFVNDAVEYLLVQHGDVPVQLPKGRATLKSIPSDTLQAMVWSGIRRARAHGLSWESNLLAFVVMMFVAAPNFDEHPLIRQAVESEDASPDERFEQIWDNTTEENWEASIQSYNTSAWNLELSEK